MIDIIQRSEKEIYLIQVSGEIDNGFAARTLWSALRNGKKHKIIKIDLSDVSFANSNFIDVLIRFSRRDGYPASQIMLDNPNQLLRDMLSITGACRIFNVYAGSVCGV